MSIRLLNMLMHMKYIFDVCQKSEINLNLSNKKV